MRELDHVLGRAVLRGSAERARGAPILIGPEHLQLGPVAAAPAPSTTGMSAARDGASTVVSVDGMTLQEAVEETKRTLINRAVANSGGNWAAAARSLGMARSNLHHMAKRLGVRE